MFLQTINAFFHAEGREIAQVFCTVWSFLAPALGVLILWWCVKPLLRFRREPETWAWLVMPDGQQLPVTHWENIIGRSKGCDIIVNLSTVSRNHAVLTRYDDGSWSLTDIGSRGAVSVNGKQVEVCALRYGDVISLGGVEMVLAPTTAEEVEEQKYYRTKPAAMASPGLTLFLLTLFQLLTALQFWMSSKPEEVVNSVAGVLAVCALSWLLFLILKIMRRSSFEVETLAFFLSTLGLAVIASSDAGSIPKQLVCIAGGIFIYLLLGWSLRDLSRAKRFRYVAAVAGLALLAANLVLGREINGAKNWIAVGSMSFQPSELVKLCFIYVGASTMDRIVTKRNLFSFILYSGAICGCLALMNDFGTALIFFVALVVICLMRGGSFSAVSLLATLAVCAALLLLVIDIPPHVMRRFSTWGHAWDDPLGGGYDQVKAMTCIASGGLFGLGAGNGMFTYYVMAADTDYVFAFVCEEWGLIVGLLPILAIIVLGVFVARSASVGRSSFYTIGACAAVAIMMTQTILNVFGTMDLLPMTGVTFPFLSNGGSSMLSSWGLLAFIKAADTRQDASFAVRTARSEEVEPYE
ncbi:MAG: FtsW/RodA/SpoVE family cell cycle protein [Oscillospiraceae bacterium]|nr:FtsW/RodA/SpoVE family cell cycle protein [Oscillospiraceae bacterium]